MKLDNSINLRKRLQAILFAVTFIFTLLLSRFVYLQIFKFNEYNSVALDQWNREIYTENIRGQIFDRTGVVLVDNQTKYSLYIRPRMVSDPNLLSKYLSENLSLDYNKILTKISNKNISEILVKKDIDFNEMNKIVQSNFTGIYYSLDNARTYPHKELMSQVLGYTSLDNVGQEGLELYYNNILAGINGSIITQTDLVGLEKKDSEKYIVDGIDGYGISLTIDYKYQEFVENAVKTAFLNTNAKNVSVVLMNPNTGEVLALANYPSYDLNNVPRDDLSLLASLSRNKVVVDVYEPGSTFKIITSAANIEEYFKGNKNAYALSHVFNSSRTRVVDGQKISCWDGHLKGKHSNLNLSGALNNSCNPLFVDIAMSLGKDKMYEYINKFGFGKKTGIDFVGEANGIVLDENLAKLCDVARISFGQTIAVSPLQLINACSAAINGGNLFVPYLLKDIVDSNNNIVYKNSPRIQSVAVSENTSKVIREYLNDVVADGSGRNAAINGVNVGGKTGTAQKYVDGKISGNLFVSSFIGFFPSEKPEYICLAIVDEPEGEHFGSTIAAPIVKNIFEQIINDNKQKK